MKEKLNKVKNQYVLVINRDKNGKPKYYVCENMETAKKNFSSDVQKQFITMILDK